MGTKALLSRRFELPAFVGCLAVFSIGLLAATCCPATAADKIQGRVESGGDRAVHCIFMGCKPILSKETSRDPDRCCGPFPITRAGHH
jgi:hypothetical protein